MNFLYNKEENKKVDEQITISDENTHIIKEFLNLCRENTPTEFIDNRKYNPELINKLNIGLCTKEVYSKLCNLFDRDKLKELGFYGGGEGKYLQIYVDRVIFPFDNSYFSARSQKSDIELKYKNLFPAAKFFGGKKPYYLKGISDTLILCEGETDSIALKHVFPKNHILGIGGVQEAQKYVKYADSIENINKIIICFDNDESGEKARDKILNSIDTFKYEVSTLNFGSYHKDFDLFYRECQERSKEQIKIVRYEKESLKTSIIDAKTLIQSDIPETKWLINDLLVKGGTTIIGGDSGAGKSLLSLNLSMHLVNGKTIFDSFECEKVNVLYIDEENIPNTIKTRITQLSKTRDIKENLENLHFSIMEDIKLDTAQGKRTLGKEKFLNLMNQYKPQVCVIDSLVRFFCGDENSSNDVKEIFDTLKFCTKNFGTSFIILHHTTKMNGGTSRKHTLRGSGDLSAFADIVLILNKISNTNLVGIYQEKNRHQEPIKPFNMMINQIDGNLNVCYGGDKSIEFETVSQQCEQNIIDVIKENDWIEFKTAILKPIIIKKGNTDYSYKLAIKSLINQGWLSEGQKKGEYKINNSFRELCKYE